MFHFLSNQGHMRLRILQEKVSPSGLKNSKLFCNELLKVYNYYEDGLKISGTILLVNAAP